MTKINVPLRYKTKEVNNDYTKYRLDGRESGPIKTGK